MPPPEVRGRVLVVDDDQAVREILATVLTEEGFTIVGTAADGAEGVALARKLCPDAIVMDVRMPHVGGLDAARVIRAVDREVRLVILSAYDDPALQQEASALGAVAFLVKGCPLADLVDAVAGRT